MNIADFMNETSVCVYVWRKINILCMECSVQRIGSIYFAFDLTIQYVAFGVKQLSLSQRLIK